MGKQVPEGLESIIGEAARKAEQSAVVSELTSADASELLWRYYRHTATEELAKASPTDLAGAVLSHVSLAGKRGVGEARVRVHNPTVEEHGWQAGHTVVEIVTDDMPFLVDSVTAELSNADRPIHQVIHPTLLVRRDENGELLEICDADAAVSIDGSRDPSWPDDAVVESWMHIEIDLESDEADRVELTTALERVLCDVRRSVEDWPGMQKMASELALRVVDSVPSDLRDEAGEAARLLTWMAEHHFTFLGYREYRLTGQQDDQHLSVVPGSGLGILRDSGEADSVSFARLSPPVRSQARERSVLILTKANSRATVHRPVYLDYVGVKTFDEFGNVTGEHRFLGLLTSAAYTQSVRSIPVIDTKVKDVMEQAGFATGSHSDKDLQTLLETYPRDELLQMSSDELYKTAMSVMHLQERRQTRVFTRRDRYGRFASVLVFLPRDRYTTQVRVRMQDILRTFFDASEVDYSTRLTESVLARLHFVARAAKDEMIAEDFDREGLEAKLVAATRSWEEDLADAMVAEIGEEETGRILGSWDDFPEAYKEQFDPRLATVDMRRLQRLIDEADDDSASTPANAVNGAPVGGVVMNLYQPLGAGAERRRFKIYRREPLTLTRVLPLFRHMGVEVIDERPYELRRKDGSTAYVYDFGIECPGEHLVGSRERFTEAFAAAWLGMTETDGLDRLVLFAKLTWRQVVILRAYTKYMRQIGVPFSQNYIEKVLLDNAHIARALVELFEARFDPSAFADHGSREKAEAGCRASITELLDGVASLDADRILRLYLDVINGTVRTNFYQTDAEGQPKSYVSMKLLPQRIEELPEPRPAYEIWVFSPRVEGVHLRFGDVARGGLRWSDRREDFRTEVLGLVKAQMVKNAVIVPTGAKGGFYPKRLPDPAVDRNAWLEEGIACYKIFISSLLDITDNYGARNEDGTREVLPPQNVVRHDGDDPYLVVAADKGTATFSDIANGVARDYGFWLDDAFASGGSVGYDHKAMGITAKGAWESVKRHFREMGHDTQSEEFTVVGIGDMSGDVFGNGMLLSEHIRLVAAFNHMHIFVDPNPDAASSFAERKRLFESERGTWDKYDTSLISEGGGVFDRSSKSIDVTPHMREALGIDSETNKMTPLELISAILRAPADLLWNGGIGTYVKASSETHLQVGDRANDAIRLNGDELRVRVVGEGGNLGMTQLGRIEAALHGVRLNTDAIDNSAGVDCSDHEVNIKILLDQAVTEGDLTEKQRNELLASMTDDVSDLVLADNIEQNVLLSNARQQSAHMLGTHQRFIKQLEAAGQLDRELEFLPSDKQMAAREEADMGLTSPELSVLLAYAKIQLQEALLPTSLPDEPWFEALLRDYFPDDLHEKFGDKLAEHPLAREIIVMAVSNELVNRGGITFAYRAAEETGADIESITRAFVISRSVFGLHEYVGVLDNVDISVSTSVQTRMYLEFRRLLDRSARWFLQNRVGQLDVAAEIDRFTPLVSAYRARMDEVLVGTELERLHARRDHLVESGVPEDIALWEAGLLDAFSLLDVHGLVESVGIDPAYVVALYFQLSERYRVDYLLDLVAALPRESRWTSLARGAMRDDLYAVLEGLTAAVLDQADVSAQDPDSGVDMATARETTQQWISAWEQRNESQLVRVRSTLSDVDEMEDVDLATLSVVLRQMRGVVRVAQPSAG